jgi:hypothetical protein
MPTGEYYLFTQNYCRSKEPNFSASSLDGTVVGILFEKTGSEIRDAIGSKIANINGEIDTLVAMITPIKGFLESKDAELESIKELQRGKEKELKVNLSPLVKKRKALLKKVDDLDGDKDDSVDVFNEQSNKFFAKPFKNFNDGWDDIIEVIEKANIDISDEWELPVVESKPSSSSSSRVMGHSSSSCSSDGRKAAKTASAYHVTTTNGLDYASMQMWENFESDDVRSKFNWRNLHNDMARKISMYKITFQEIKKRLRDLRTKGDVLVSWGTT